jgi:hypothetical protein
MVMDNRLVKSANGVRVIPGIISKSIPARYVNPVK